MKEEKISDQSKLKKCKQDRQIKIMGDLALMINKNCDLAMSICNNENINEIYNLQDSCLLNIQIVKKDFLISLELQSQILIDGQFNQILNEDCESYASTLKLRKLPLNQLTNPDLKVIWKNLFHGTIGILNPFQHLSLEYIFKLCCNDFIDIECKESNRNIYLQINLT
ncbi:unnamed protein product [Paramecium octaurelia]|uniref:Uncharacterized protein n=1 Tax=Paramecium octaurelia TaxID=43137 RepID=A0A8S1UAY9_PAROT|nr:unnamed protein product [Paramecium octaurelia]